MFLPRHRQTRPGRISRNTSTSATPDTQRNATLDATNLVRDLGGNEPRFWSRWGLIAAGAPPQLGRAKTMKYRAKIGVFWSLEALLFRSGPASGTPVRSHERTGAGTARESPRAGPAQTLNRPAAPCRAVRADRAGAQFSRNPSTRDDEPLARTTAGRADGDRNPCAVKIAAAATAFTAALARGAARLVRFRLGTPRRL